MQWKNTETPTFAGSNNNAVQGPDVVETMQLLDRDGAVVATFTKQVDGSLSLSLPGSLAVIGDLSVSGSSQIFTASEHIADPTGAATDQDDEARAAIASILDLLEAQGLMEAEA